MRSDCPSRWGHSRSYEVTVNPSDLPLKLARSRVPWNHPEREDIEQEALIAGWRTADRSEAYRVRSILNRVNDALLGARLGSKRSSSGGPTARVVTEVVSRDALPFNPPEDARTPDYPSDLGWAYSAAQDAVDRYVIEQVASGRKPKAIATQDGIDAVTRWRRLAPELERVWREMP